MNKVPKILRVTGMPIWIYGCGLVRFGVYIFKWGLS